MRSWENPQSFNVALLSFNDRTQDCGLVMWSDPAGSILSEKSLKLFYFRIMRIMAVCYLYTPISAISGGETILNKLAKLHYYYRPGSLLFSLL